MRQEYDDTKIWTDGIEIMHFDKDGQYVEILGHKIDKSYTSFEAFVEDMNSLTKFREEIANHTYYDIKKMHARQMYEVLCRDMSFNSMIELYKLIQFKMNFLRDSEEWTNCKCVEGEE